MYVNLCFCLVRVINKCLRIRTFCFCVFLVGLWFLRVRHLEIIRACLCEVWQADSSTVVGVKTAVTALGAESV